MGMDCRKIEPLISPYVDGELMRAEAAEVKAHLVVCACCSQKYELMLQMSSALQQIGQVMVPAPTGFTASVMERINSEGKLTKQPVRQRWIFDHWRQAVAGVAAAVMLAFGALTINSGPIIQIAENLPSAIQADNDNSAIVNPPGSNNGVESNSGTNANSNQNGTINSGSTNVAQNSVSNSSPLVLLNKERNLTTILLQIKTGDSSAALKQTMSYAAQASAQVQNFGQQANENGSYTVLQITVAKATSDSLISSLANLGNVTDKEVNSTDITTQFADKLSQYQALVAQRSSAQDENQLVSLNQQIKVLENELKDWDLKAEQETIILWMQK